MYLSRYNQNNRKIYNEPILIHDIHSLKCNKECILICCILLGLHIIYVGSVVYIINQDDDYSLSLSLSS